MKKRTTTLAAILLVAGLGAQSTRSARSVSIGSHRLDTSVPDALVSISASGELAVAGFDINGDLNGHSAVTGVGAPGDLESISMTGKKPDVLAVGRDASGKGIIEHWSENQTETAYVNMSSLLLTGRDFTGVAYDDDSNLLYLLDAVSNKIYRASWNGFGSLATLSLSAWATTANVADLSNSASRQIRILRDPLGGTNHKVFLGSWPVYSSGGISISGSAGSIISVDHDLLEGRRFIVAERVLPVDTSVSEGANTVEVEAPDLTPIQVVNLETDEVLGTGFVVSGSTTVTLTENLVIGRIYAVRKVGVPTNPCDSFVAVRRYGFPETLSDGTKVEKRHAPTNAYVGNLDFGMSVALLDTTPPATASVLPTGLLIVNVRDVDGNDPILTLANGNTLLLSDVILGAEGVMKDDGRGFYFAELPIPNDTSLLGTVLLTQFGVPSGSSIGLSEVVGVQIRATPISVASATSTSSVTASRALTIRRVWMDALRVIGSKVPNRIRYLRRAAHTKKGSSAESVGLNR